MLTSRAELLHRTVAGFDVQMLAAWYLVRMMEAREGIATDWEKPKTMATEAGENRRRTSALTAKRKDARTARKGQRDSTDEEHETEG